MQGDAVRLRALFPDAVRLGSVLSLAFDMQKRSHSLPLHIHRFWAFFLLAMRTIMQLIMMF